jgi:hypothetical protein
MSNKEEEVKRAKLAEQAERYIIILHLNCLIKFEII